MHIIHIGFSKCASTFLQSHFRKLGCINYIEKSHFFNLLYNEFNNGFTYYKSLFDNTGDEPINLESDEHLILPDYHPVLKSHGTRLESVKKILHRIKTELMNAKIILVIRNQYDLIISRYAQFIVGGGKLSFGEFVDEMLNCSFNGQNYYENYYYIIISMLNDSFGKNRVLVILYENLKSNPDFVIKQIKNFIGLDSEISIEKSIKNQRMGLSLFGLKILRFINSIIVIEKETINTPARLTIPRIIYKNLFVRGIRLIDYFLPKKLTKSKKHLLDRDIKKKLINAYSKDNDMLNNLFDFDIRRLGYK